MHALYIVQFPYPEIVKQGAIVAEDYLQVALLSPSLFSLHNKGRGTEALLSLPHVIQSTANSDYKHWLNFIIETSGVSDAVDEVLVSKPDCRIPKVLTVRFVKRPFFLVLFKPYLRE